MAAIETLAIRQVRRTGSRWSWRAELRYIESYVGPTSPFLGQRKCTGGLSSIGVQGARQSPESRPIADYRLRVLSCGGEADVKEQGSFNDRSGNNGRYRVPLFLAARDLNITFDTEGDQMRSVICLNGYKLRHITKLAAALLLLAPLAGRPQPVSIEADPTQYGYHPDSVLGLGRGFSPKDITRPMLPCIKGDKVRLDDGPPRTTFSVTQVRSIDDIAQAINLELKVQGRYLAAKAHAHFKLDRSFLSQRDAATIAINGTTDFGRWALAPGAVLTAEATEMLRDPTRFAAACGTRYVAMEQKAASVDILISIFHASTTLRSAMDASASIAGGSGALSASASSAFFKEYKRAAQQGRTSVQILATGGAGFAALSDFVRKLPAGDTNLAPLYQGIATYLETFSSANAVAYRFSVQSMEQFGLDVHNSKSWDQEHEDRLNAMADYYHELSDQVKVAEDWLAGGPWKVVRPWIKEKNLAVWLQLAEIKLSQVRERHESCLKGDDAACTFQINSILWDDLRPAKIPEVSFIIFPYTCSRAVDSYATGSCPWVGGDQQVLQQAITGRGAIAILDAMVRADAELSVLQSFSPRAGTFTASADIDSEWQADETYQLVYSDTDGMRDVSIEEAKWDHPWIYGFRTYRGSEVVHPRAIALMGITPYSDNSAFDLLIRWMIHFDGEHDGTFLLRIRDRFGRVFLLPLMDATWSANGASVLKITHLAYY